MDVNLEERGRAGPSARPPFQLKPRTATITFDEGPMGLGGLVIDVRLNVSIDFYFQLDELISMLNADKPDAKQIRQMLRAFADEVLEDWNYHDRHGNLVPATPDGFLRLDIVTALLIITKYRGLIGRVPDPKVSTNGNTSKARKASKSRSRLTALSS